MRISRWCGIVPRAMIMAAMAVICVTSISSAQTRSVQRVIQVDTDGSYLGIQMDDVTAENMASYKLSSERGVIVRSVEKGTPAETAGLLEKDVILEYAGMPVQSSAQFARMVRETPVGRKVDLVVSREGKKLNFSAKIGKREGESGWSGNRTEIHPDDRSDRHFEFRIPGPRSFNFQMPDDGWENFSIPEGGRRAYLKDDEKPRLGVTLQGLTNQLAEFLGVPGKKGAMVTAVTEGSPAAGRLKAGDVIIRAEDRSIADPEDLAKAVSGKEGKLGLTIIRDRKEISVGVELPKIDPKPGKGGFRL